MKARRALLVAGSVWELARFVLVLFLFAAVLRATTGAGAGMFPWLMVAGSGNLLVGAGSLLLALFPARYAPVVALLRLGKLLGLASLVLLVPSGALRTAAGIDMAAIGRGGLRAGAVVLAVLLLDLLFLAVLVSWRPDEDPPPADPPGEKLPEYHETEVQHFH
ncbi:MAG TPA: hypothetical protein VFI08_04035 [Spirochaetia bacterium]|nr:hypothetical protein [Spirochaetia bacterium]